MIDEKDIHVRNIKLISSFFIVYWLLDLTPSGDSIIRLPFISYEIHNPSLLPWLANISLIYFFWRFWLSTNTVGKFFHSYRNLFSSKFDKINLINTRYRGILMEKATVEIERFINQEAEDILKSLIPKLTKDQVDSIISSSWEVVSITKGNSGTPLKAKSFLAIVQWNAKTSRGENFKYHVPVNISWYMFCFTKIRCFLTAIFMQERFATYTLSWVWFSLAILSSILILIDFSPQDLSTSFKGITRSVSDILLPFSES
ncbi:hypothetical protein VBY75_05075 [Idiomarina sp. HB]|uniref:hypothetical protein n=1 Tax=Idiomarina sp. HB TaxID=3110479 RepID=UPI003A80B606